MLAYQVVDGVRMCCDIFNQQLHTCAMGNGFDQWYMICWGLVILLQQFTSVLVVVGFPKYVNMLDLCIN